MNLTVQHRSVLAAIGVTSRCVIIQCAGAGAAVHGRAAGDAPVDPRQQDAAAASPQHAFRHAHRQRHAAAQARERAETRSRAAHAKHKDQGQCVLTQNSVRGSPQVAFGNWWQGK